MVNLIKLLSAGILLVALSFVAGCDQPDDVVTPISETTFTLSEQRLPNNPDGMIYELWVANSADTASLGRFNYDFLTRTFSTPLGAELDPVFTLSENVGDYDVIFVSVELTTDTDDSPGPIMLIANVNDQTVEMTFPEMDAAWESTIRYNMESTSDGRDNANDGSSIWLANYNVQTKVVIDTNDIDEWHLELGTYVDSNEFIPSENIRGIDSNTLVFDDTIVVYGLDTFTYNIIRFDYIISYDTSGYFPSTFRIDYIVDSTNVPSDNFTQDDFGLPNLQDYGWKYQGWVVSPYIDPAAVGTITLPAWSILGSEFDHTDGGLLSIGQFYDITAPDLGNPYVDVVYKNPPRVPPFPGEDFMMNLPGGLSAPFNLVPFDVDTLDPTASHGKVFITVEPENDPYPNTNFPLFFFIGELPQTRAEVVSSNQGFTLTGQAFVNDPYRGLPLITVTKKTF